MVNSKKSLNIVYPVGISKKPLNKICVVSTSKNTLDKNICCGYFKDTSYQIYVVGTSKCPLIKFIL